MKAAFIVLTVCLIGAYGGVLNDEQKNKLRGYKEACIKDTGVDAAVVGEMVKGVKVARDQKLDCFSACILKKIGIMRADGTIDVETAKTKAAQTSADTEKSNKIIDACKDQTGKDECEVGGNLAWCIAEKKEFPLLH